MTSKLSKLCTESMRKKVVLMLSRATSHPYPTESDQDKDYNYTNQALVLLLLRINHKDAIKLGDINLFSGVCVCY